MHTPAAALAVHQDQNSNVVTPATSLKVDAVFDGRVLRATILESAPDVIEAFSEMPVEHRSRLIETSWTIGLRAAMNAHRLASEARLADVGQEMCHAFRAELEAYQGRQEQAIARVFAEYFHSEDGRVPARIDAFLSDDGELARSMARYLAPDGQLAKTLAQAFGDGSPLMKRLSPTDSQGLVHMIEARLGATLDAQKVQLAAALDPANETGALGRFFQALKVELVRAAESRDKQVAAIAKALDVGDATSAMSRFFGETRAAHRSLLQAMNAEDPASPLGAIKGTLVKLLEKHAKEHHDVLSLMEERQRKDSIELREAITKLETKRRVEARSAAGGLTFEDTVVAAAADMLRGAPITVEATGATVGHRSGSKKGDAVVRFSAEHKYAGASVVIEAKHDASYSVTKALEELAAARANRDASVGLFVMARSHAPVGFPRFRRYGADVLVTWDDGDPESDVILEIALSLALFMAPQGRRESEDREDIEALHDIQGRIESEIKRWQKIRKRGERVRSDGDFICIEADRGEKALGLMARNACKMLRALNVPVLDTADEGEPTLLLPEVE